MKYSIDEIDEMRRLVRRLHEERGAQPYVDMPDGGWSRTMGSVTDEFVEQSLRTYMINGNTVEEVRSTLAAAVAKGENVRFSYADLMKAHGIVE